jgi:hypothetical protein
MGMDGSGPVEVEGAGVRHPPGSLHDSFFNVNVQYLFANGVKMNLRSGGGLIFSGEKGKLPGKGVAMEPIGPNEVHLYRTDKGHLGCWLECIRSRKDPSAPVEAGHRSSTLCHLANIAMTLGRKLRWDPVKEEFVGDEEANRMTWRPYRAPWTL